MHFVALVMNVARKLTGLHDEMYVQARGDELA
jgi:hypothetical protein